MKQITWQVGKNDKHEISESIVTFEVEKDGKYNMVEVEFGDGTDIIVTYFVKPDKTGRKRRAFSAF